MKPFARSCSFAALAASALLLVAWQVHAETNRVQFPENLDQLVHYTTVKRGSVTEHILTTPEAIEAVRNRVSRSPSGTHFMLVDYREGEVFRYFVMEKGDGFGTRLRRAPPHGGLAVPVVPA
jgi:hypothetical protein